MKATLEEKKLYSQIQFELSQLLYLEKYYKEK